MVQQNYYRVAKLLIDLGAEVNEITNEQSLLYITSRLGYLESTKMLLRHGADPTFCDSGGNTPLMVAIEGGHTFVCEDLVNEGARVSHKNQQG